MLSMLGDTFELMSGNVILYISFTWEFGTKDKDFLKGNIFLFYIRDWYWCGCDKTMSVFMA